MEINQTDIQPEFQSHRELVSLGIETPNHTLEEEAWWPQHCSRELWEEYQPPGQKSTDTWAPSVASPLRLLSHLPSGLWTPVCWSLGLQDAWKETEVEVFVTYRGMSPPLKGQTSGTRQCSGSHTTILCIHFCIAQQIE